MKPLLSLLLGVALSFFAGGSGAQVETQLGREEAIPLFGDSPDLLPPDEAFRGQLKLDADNTALALSFDIENDYYLYRDRFAIEVIEGDVVLANAQWPKAKIYSDPYFGEQAIYRNHFSAKIPLVSSSSSNATIEVTYQGCADVGVCFPPTKSSFSLTGLNTISTGANNLSANTAASDGTSTQMSALEKLNGLFTNDSPSSVSGASADPIELVFDTNPTDLLHPSEAFRYFVETTPAGLSVNWNIEPGYYLYKEKTTYSLKTDSGDTAEFTGTEREDGESYHDEFFGNTTIFRNSTTDRLNLAAATSGRGELTVKYQGCADIGVCFPPETVNVPVSWNVTEAAPDQNDGTNKDVLAASAIASTGVGGGNAGGGSGGSPLQLSEQDRLATQLATSSLLFNAAAFFVFGLLLAFTPCVLPMIPILSSLILGGGEKRTTAQSFRLSLTYVMGMALTYTLVGVLVGLSGYNIQAWFQDPVILSAFALLFVVLSLAMFGVYELQLPAGMQTRLMSLSNKQSGGRSGGVFVMGILSALIVGPCVTAPLMGALIYIADTGDAWVGATALFSLSIGMGTPLILIGTSAGKWVPKAGGWMSAVKIIFGFMMLGMAIWMLSRFLDPSYVVLLSSALALCAGMWALFEYTKSDNAMALRTVGSAAGLAASVYGISLLLSTLNGNPSLLKPLHGFGGGGSGGTSVAKQHLAFKRIKSVADVESVVKAAGREGKTVMLDFYADWCVSCKEMEAFTFTDAGVQAQLNDVELIQADVTANDKEDQELLKAFGLFGPPAIIFYDGSGNEVRNARLVGFLNAAQFSSHLDAVFAASRSTASLAK